VSKRRSNKVIISCAITGSIHTPTMSPYLPCTPEEIAQSAIGAAREGAAILHLHARDPKDGRPSPDPALFQRFLPQIRSATRAVLNITTGGSPRMSVDERIRTALTVRPEMCSLNMGSINFSVHPLADKYEWKHEWEREYVAGSEDLVFRNTFRDVRRILKDVGEGCGTRFEFECYDVGHLYNLAHFADAGLVKPPFFVQSIFGILGGIGPDLENVQFMRQTADRLFGDDYEWSILGAGRHQFSLLTCGALLGGHVRVGLEDNLYLDRGILGESNAQMVRKARTILENLGFAIATPDEARAMLQLRGAEAAAA